MTYDEQIQILAEKMAELRCQEDDRFQWRFLSAASKKKRTKQMMPQAKIAIDFAREMCAEGYTRAITDLTTSKTLPLGRHLTTLGLTPDKTT